MSRRLAAKSLGSFTGIQIPNYDRDRVSPGILHLGVGGFHRAHQAVYTEDILAEDSSWGILGASLRSARVRERLQPQDFLYGVCTRSGNSEHFRAVGAIQDVLTLPRHRDQIIEAIASAGIRVITLTITEKGYCHRLDGSLDETHPDIAHDLSNPGAEVSAPGVLVAGLQRRRQRDSGPITILSCDNLAGNGGVLRRVVLGLADRIDPELADWCIEQASFPSSMVDRIVPATKDADLRRCEAVTGMWDKGLVVCEAFKQWIIEDQFAAERPPWDRSGATFVRDVAPFEHTKLRLLNATHSALAYLGMLAGHEFIHEAMEDVRLADFAVELMDTEIAPLIDPPSGLDLEAYMSQILARFSNGAIAYSTAQVATDGSKKLRERIFPSILDRYKAGLSSPLLCRVVAAWLKCMRNPHLAKQFTDPVLSLVQAQPESGLIRSVATQTDLFGELGEYPEIIESIEQAY